MVHIPKDFDGQKFMDKFQVGMHDFRIDNDVLICPSLPNLTDEDIADCVTDWEQYYQEHPNKVAK